MPPAAAVTSTVSAAVIARDLEDRHRRPAGADHRDRGVVGEPVGQHVHRVDLADRELGVAARSPGRGAPPRGGRASRHRRRRRARRPRRRPRGPGSPAAPAAGTGPSVAPARMLRVDQVHAGGRHRDPHLARPRAPGPRPPRSRRFSAGPELAAGRSASSREQQVRVAELVPAVAVVERGARTSARRARGRRSPRASAGGWRPARASR